MDCNKQLSWIDHFGRVRPEHRRKPMIVLRCGIPASEAGDGGEAPPPHIVAQRRRGWK